VSSVPPPGRSAPPPRRDDRAAPTAQRRVPAARTVAAAGAVGLVTWAASSALAHDRPADVRGLSATGAVHLLSPEAGTAVLTAGRLIPGQSVTGTVHLTNDGDADGGLTLARTAIADTPGAGGGKLSAALQLRIDDITGGASSPVYSGDLDGPGLVPMGRLRAGAARTYRLTATLPDSGRPSGPLAGDNALQGSSVRVDWAWQAESLAVVTPTPTPTATPTRTPTPVTKPPAAPPAPPQPVSGEDQAASVLTLRIPWQRVMTTRGITVWGSCDQLCRLTFSAKVQTAPRKGHRKTVMRGRVFRVRGTKRTLHPGAERRIKLRLTPQAVRRLHAVLLTRGRAGVQINARVRSSLGAATVKRRIVLVTSHRAARHRAAQRGR
jgi:hypothetical protein